MLTDLFDYTLPRELIAAAPLARRDASRLLVIQRETQAIEHAQFRDLPRYLRAGDVMVVNNSRVIRARIHGKRSATGGHVEFLLLERSSSGHVEPGTDKWIVLCRPAKKLKPGEEVYFANKQLLARVLHYCGEGEREVQFNTPDVLQWLEKIGEVPLPPYIVQRRKELMDQGITPSDSDPAFDIERYQTVYAQEPGSVAAPTAGLHLSAELLDEIRAKGVQVVEVTLHVGPGTFKPVEVENVEDHPMHSEHYQVPADAAAAIQLARNENRRVIAIGTTSVRTLESAFDASGNLQSASGNTQLMIVPGYKFQVIDALVTNFHLPRSTLLMLVSAFAGRELVLRAYQEAIDQRYRFFSYGDAMVIL